MRSLHAHAQVGRAAICAHLLKAVVSLRWVCGRTPFLFVMLAEGKLKIFLAFIFLCFQFICEAQTNEIQYQTILITNWIKPGPYLRVVNGITYNTAYSKLWDKFSHRNGLGISLLDPSNDGEISRYYAKLCQVKEGTAYFDIHQVWQAHETYTGVLYTTRDEYVSSVIVFNCTDPFSSQLDFMCMEIKNHVNSNGVPYRAFDCGIQATNLVPVTRRTVLTNEFFKP